MSDPTKILVVDDEPMNRTVMTELLGAEFEIQCADDSLACIDILDSWSPDLILMDVKMPGIDGLETCRQIRSNPETEYIPVIFVSALNLPEERIAGYEAGGDDYIVKPYNEQELLQKIRLSIENSQKLKEFKQSSQESMQTALTAMTNTAELGNILHFYQDSFSIDSYDEVADKLLEVLSGYGLNAVISIFTPEKQINKSNTGAVRAIEISVIEQVRKRETIFNFGEKSAYSYSNITILVLNMPLEDQEKHGRLKDHIAMLAEGGNARILSLITQQDKRKHQAHLQDLVNATSLALQGLDQQQSANQKEMEDIMRQLTEQVEASFLKLGLTETQEEQLLNIIKTSEENAKTLFDKDLLLRQELESIMDSLKQA